MFSFCFHANISIGIWSGKEMLLSRSLEQAQTWMRVFPKVYIFSDEFPEEVCKRLNQASSPCIVECVEIGDQAQYLLGTGWEHRWYYAQPRFLHSMVKLYELNNQSSWFLFGDDDTYFFSDPIYSLIQEFSPDQNLAIGKVWNSWSSVMEGLEPQRDEHPFLQGGAGVLLSHKLLSSLSPILINCSDSLTNPDFAGSMRFAICAERFFGVELWNNGEYILNRDDLFHSVPPNQELPVKPPISFHRIFPGHFHEIANAHLSFSNNSITDLSAMTFTRSVIPLGRKENRFEWIFGYAIVALGQEEKIISKSISSFKKVSDHYEQDYEKGIRIILKCDNRLPFGHAYFTHFIDQIGNSPVMITNCSRFHTINI